MAIAPRLASSPPPPVGRAAAPPCPAGFRAGGRGRDQGVGPARISRSSSATGGRRARPPRSSRRTRSRPRPSSCRGPISRPRPTTRAAGRARRRGHLDERLRERGDRRGRRRRPARPSAGSWPARRGIDEQHVLLLSTGIIGTRLPVDRVEAGVGNAVLRAARRRRRTRGRCRGAAHDRLAPKAATTTLVLPAADGAPVP